MKYLRQWLRPVSFCMVIACGWMNADAWCTHKINFTAGRWQVRKYSHRKNLKVSKGSLSLKPNNEQLVYDDDDSKQAVDKKIHRSISIEKEALQLIVEALVSIFYPSIISSDQVGNSDKNGEFSTVDAEKALKRSLRRVQQLDYVSATERRWMRQELATYILGTSIWRLRHWYVLLQKTVSSEISWQVIDGAISLKCTQLFLESKTDSGNACEKNQLKTVYALIELHKEFLQQRSNEVDENGSNEHKAEKDSYAWPENDPVEFLSVQYSLPSFVARLLVNQYGIHEAQELAAISNEPGPITLRRNAIQCASDQELCLRLQSENGIVASPLEFLAKRKSMGKSFHAVPNGCIRIKYHKPPHTTSIWSTSAWKEGWFEVQEAGSQLIVNATEASFGDVVVDYCAGNGGKTLALASQMWGTHDIATSIPSTESTYQSQLDEQARHGDDMGRIIAHDVVEERLRQIKGSLSRAGIDPARIKTSVSLTGNSHNVSADVVLVDAPCSSLGVLRRRPSQRWRLTSEHYVTHELPALQLDILQQASRLVKQGGRLIYATCSICHAENEGVVDAFQASDDFTMCQWTPWPFDQSRESDTLNDAIVDTEYSHCQTLLPHRHESDGFFIARWKRI
jgi:16S rRNA C967 or C1407 C5-methylase (RsmB/RsmF family)